MEERNKERISPGLTAKHRRLQKDLEILEADWNRRTEKVKRMREALAIEVGTAAKFQLEQQLFEQEKERADLTNKINQIEEQLNQIEVKKQAKVNVDNNIHQLKNIHNPKIPSPQPKDAIRQQHIQPPVNTKLPSNTKSQPQPAPATIKKGKSTIRSISTVDYAIAVGKKMWFIMLPIVMLWFVLGIYGLKSDNQKSLISIWIISGSLGGALSGLGGCLAWWRVAPRLFQWEQVLLFLTIGVISGAISWAIVGKILDTWNLQDSYGSFVGLLFGFIVVCVIIWQLSLRRSKY
ncbi:MAG: hypothetical protein RMY34_10395 [Aulosira sp. DedQUE10]|nr:hypothetical protein [Aulosira sp. DedQUE10]